MKVFTFIVGAEVAQWVR